MKKLKLSEIRGACPKSELGSQDTHRCIRDGMCVIKCVLACAHTQSAWDWLRTGTTNDSTTLLTAGLAAGLGTWT